MRPNGPNEKHLQFSVTIEEASIYLNRANQRHKRAQRYVHHVHRVVTCDVASHSHLVSEHKSQWQQREAMFPRYYKPTESLSPEKSTWPQTQRSPGTFQVMVETPRHVILFSVLFSLSQSSSARMTGNILKCIQIWGGGNKRQNRSGL